MWVVLTILSALFAGLMTVLSKLGTKGIGWNVVVFVRMFFVFCVCILFLVGLNETNLILSISYKSFLVLSLSGIFTAASWLCYFKALSRAEALCVAATEKSSAVITVLLAFLLLGESQRLFLKVIGGLILLSGIVLLLFFEKSKQTKGWFCTAFLAALFSALSSVCSKFGAEGVDVVSATAIRTFIVVIISFSLLLFKGIISDVAKIPKKELVFIFLSAVCTALGWFCFFGALGMADAGAVVPIEKTSLLFTMIFSYFILKKRVTKKELLFVTVIVTGSVIMSI